MRHLLTPQRLRGAPLTAAVLASLVLAGCSRGEDAAAPEPAPSLTTQAMPTASTDGEPLTAGQWSIEETAGGASAVFGEPGSAPLLRMVCDRENRAVTLVRSDAGAEAQVLAIAVGEQRAAVQMEPIEAGQIGLQAEIDQTQPIFAAFADPAETIEISAPGTPTLRLPAHSGISRVVQACS